MMIDRHNYFILSVLIPKLGEASPCIFPVIYNVGRGVVLYDERAIRLRSRYGLD